MCDDCAAGWHVVARHCSLALIERNCYRKKFLKRNTLLSKAMPYKKALLLGPQAKRERINGRSLSLNISISVDTHGSVYL